MKSLRLTLLLLAAVAGSVPAFSQCTITPNQPAVGAGQSVTFTSHNCGTPSPGFSAACQGTGCSAGTINATSGVYTGASVPAQMYARGCQIGPNNSIYTHPVNAAAGISTSTYATQWSGRTWSFLSPFHIAGTPGNVSEYDNIVPDLAPRMTYNFFEGGISGQKFLEPAPPYAITEAGWSQDVQVNGSFDNHIMSLDPTTCEYDQIYKWYLDLPTASFVANGSTTLVNFTTQTVRTLQNPVHVWVYKLSGSCPSSLINGDTGWFAQVTSQPNQHGGSGQLSLPVSFSGSTSGCLITGVDEGNGFSQNTSSLNAQSGAIYPLNSNSLLPGGTNAAQTPIIGIRPDELNNNVANSNADPNDGGKVTGWHHVVVTTAGNPMIAPIGNWPAQNGTCNNEADHPCISMTNVTKASTAQVTIQAACNGSCISALNVCSGSPQFSAGQNNCVSPGGQNFDVVIEGCPAGSWAALNGQHLTATYVDPEDFTIPVNTSGYSGSYPGQCYMYFDWPPYGTIFRLKASFNCEGITNANSALVPYEKAVCRAFQTYGLMLTDGTINSDTWDTDMMSSEFDPDPLHDVFTALETALQCTNTAGTGFSQCLEPVDISSLDVNGPTDGTTNNQRVTVTYTGSTGTASVDVIQQGTTVGVLNRRVTMPAFPGSAYQIQAWINGNANTGLTYSISPSSGAGAVSSGGVLTPPTSVTSVIPAVVTVCSSAVSTACDRVQVFYYPVDSDGTARLWLGGKDGGQSGCSGQQTNNFTDNAGNVWWGTWSDAGYQRGWQSNYQNTPGLGFAGLFGSWTTNCNNWSSSPNGQLFGTSTSSGSNDEIASLAVPNGTYTVYALIEAGYNTSTTGQNVFDWMGGGSLTTPATILASFQDGYTLAGGQYRGYTAGPFSITVTDGVLHFGQQIRYWSGSQYEGNSISAISVLPGSTMLGITTTSPLPACTLNVSCSDTIVGMGGSPNYAWSIIAGAQPTGMSLCPGDTSLSCPLAGTPSVTGTFNFTVQLCDSSLTCVNKAFQLTVNSAPLVITAPVIMPTGTVGSGYTTTFTAAGGVSPYTWSTTCTTGPCSSGQIPGLSVNATSGVYSGTPSNAGTYGLEVIVTDNVGTQQHRLYGPVIIKPSAATAPTTMSGAASAAGSTKRH